MVKKLVGGEAKTSAEGRAEGSKVEKEIEEGKASAMEVEKTKPSAPAIEEPAAPNGGTRESTAPAEVAAQVADSAKKLDGTPAGGTPVPA